MILNANKFPNISRVVAGTAPLFQNDSIILCNTSAGAVNLTLLDIPANYWQTTWKLYIQDNNNNAGTNNITINAGSGQTINGQASLVINVNGGGAIVQISSNTTFAAILTNSASSFVAASLDSTTIVANCNNFSFSGFDFNVQTFTPGKAFVSQIDSGWLNLDGFNHLAGYDRRPQYRRLGKQVFFRGNAIVPLSATDSPSNTLIPMTQVGVGAFYQTDPYAYVFQGSGGCQLNSQGSCTFNNDNAVLPLLLDNSYHTGLQLAQRVVKTNDASSGVALSSVFNTIITSDGKLVVQTYKDIEDSPYIPSTTNGLGLGGARSVITKVKNGQFVPDYRTMAITYIFTVTAANASYGDIYSNNGNSFRVIETISGGTTLVCIGSGAPTGSGTLTKVSGSGDATITFSANTASTSSYTNSSELKTDFSIDYLITTPTNTFLFDCDPALENEIGGFVINLDGLHAFILTALP